MKNSKIIRNAIFTKYFIMEEMMDLILQRRENQHSENSLICRELLKLVTKVKYPDPEWVIAWVIENCMTNFSKGSNSFIQNLVDPDNTIYIFSSQFNVPEGDEDYTELYNMVSEIAKDYLP